MEVLLEDFQEDMGDHNGEEVRFEAEDPATEGEEDFPVEEEELHLTAEALPGLLARITAEIPRRLEEVRGPPSIRRIQTSYAIIATKLDIRRSDVLETAARETPRSPDSWQEAGGSCRFSCRHPKDGMEDSEDRGSGPGKGGREREGSPQET